MNYGPEQPLTASTPRATTTPVGEIQPTDPYCQIIPGMSEHLYPTLTADGLLNTPASDDCSTLHKQITSELDKYLQEAAEKREVEDNYFDGCHTSTNTLPLQQEDNYLEEEEEKHIDPANQDTLVFDSKETDEEPFNTTVDTTSDDSAITMGKPVTTAFISKLIQIPAEQVGCLLVTNQLQEFLDQYPPKSTEKAF